MGGEQRGAQPLPGKVIDVPVEENVAVRVCDAVIRLENRKPIGEKPNVSGNAVGSEAKAEIRHEVGDIDQLDLAFQQMPGDFNIRLARAGVEQKAVDRGGDIQYPARRQAGIWEVARIRRQEETRLHRSANRRPSFRCGACHRMPLDKSLDRAGQQTRLAFDLVIVPTPPLDGEQL
ncbi:MAG: hypothetical protein E5V52_14755 [Mesorhizobium sp.]|nr:MAG: hypothetical protein E5V52_14755 [Mesorhizobium sp.]